MAVIFFEKFTSSMLSRSFTDYMVTFMKVTTFIRSETVMLPMAVVVSMSIIGFIVVKMPITIIIISRCRIAP
jgi:hypothetical protein